MSVNIKNKIEKNNYEMFSSIPFRAGVELFNEIQKKGTIVFGASGEMGHAISSTFPRASIPVLMQDIDKEKLQEAKKNAIETLEKALKKRKLSKEQLKIINEKKLIDEVIAFPEAGKIPFKEINEAYLKSEEEARNFVFTFLDKVLHYDVKVRSDYSNAMMVVEAGPEVLSFKQDVFRFFEFASLSDHQVLATNTSSLKIDDIAKKIIHKERVVGFHYFLPAHINPLLEIIIGSKTSLHVVQAMQNLAISMGKKPIICFGDSTGAIANRILVGVLIEAAKIYEECGDIDLIDKTFLETFYSKQIKIQTKAAKRQFEAAPKLGFFSDESALYKNIRKIDETISGLAKDRRGERARGRGGELENKKKELLEEAEGRLRQKVLYSQIVENHENLGSFFKVPPCVRKIKLQAQDQIKKIKACLTEGTFNIEPYKFPEPENKATFLKSAIPAASSRVLRRFLPSATALAVKEVALKLLALIPRGKPRGFSLRNYKKSELNKEQIKERLQTAYITIAQDIYKEGLGTVQDIELACKEGFKWNIGPFELIQEAPSGVQTYIQDNIGFITLGRLHIQNLQMTQNSLSPDMLEAISLAIKEFQIKKVKSIIFRSQGGGAFSSGADLDYIESTNWDIDKITNFINLGKKVMNEIANCSIPTVAIIDGAAVGGGLELALACDYRIMTDLSFAALPEVGLGIIPDWGGTERLPQVVGKELAKRLICTATLKNLGLKLSVNDACDVGLADACILQSELPNFLADLMEGKNLKINIFVKPKRKENYDKKDYPEQIVKKFKLNKPFRHRFRLFTRYGAKLAEDLINHSDDPGYAERVNNDETSKKLLTWGKKVALWQIKPFIKIAQNKDLAPIFEKIGLL